MYILIYDDDMVIPGADRDGVRSVLGKLGVHNHQEGLFLDQKLYLINLLTNARMGNLRPMITQWR